MCRVSSSSHAPPKIELTPVLYEAFPFVLPKKNLEKGLNAKQILCCSNDNQDKYSDVRQPSGLCSLLGTFGTSIYRTSKIV
jgi:hypothetical protein